MVAPTDTSDIAPEPPKPESALARPSHIVGIGASAGGLDALERFFEHVPTESGMAFVVVQHLSPDFKSLMDELLARRTRLPIRLVEDGMVVEADHVYLIPAKKEMIISDGRLLLSEKDRQKELSLPIDLFFRSLARDCGRRAVAVVLSGSGSDGSRGIRDIHEAGGLVVVQDVESAQFDGMPKTARDAGVARWVLAPEEMPDVIVAHAQVGAGDGLRRDVDGAHAAGLPAVYALLEKEFGIDFTHYKPSTVTRRIERRIALARTTNLDEYLARLRAGTSELDVLYRDLLIGVTRFFRNEEAFVALGTRILPELIRRVDDDVPLRIWVAGCATGEEPYSLAIMLHELVGTDRPVKIFATDVHRGSLERAARGIYDEQAMANVSAERREAYFQRTGSSWQIVPEVRQMIVFAQHNVIRDAPFTRVDLVSCRNMLIYLQPEAQQKVLSLFHFALNRRGVLVLGPSESPGSMLPGFQTIDRHWKIYEKSTDARQTVDARFRNATAISPRLSAGSGVMPARPSGAHMLATYDALLAEYMPPALLLGENGELFHTFGGASRFLKFRDGRPGLEVFDVVAHDLKLALVGGVKRALKEPAGIVFRGVRVSDDDEELWDVTLRRVGGRDRGVVHVLALFQPSTPRAAPPASAKVDVVVAHGSREHIGALEAELTHTKENLQAAIEELETSNEELQAANEELLASNEELQSTNEELQSVNEELYTVNAEYQRKIGELTEVTNDMDNLLAATDVGTIFLDADLRIRKFTPQIGDGFDLVAHDIGRSIETFSHSMQYPTLVKDLRRVLDSGIAVERETRDAKGRAFFVRLLPYRAKARVDGVVITLIDVSGLKAAENALFHERYLFNSLLSSIPDAIYFKDANGRFIRTNPVMARRLGLEDPAAAEGRTADQLPLSDVALALQRPDEEVLESGVPQMERLEARRGSNGDAWDLTTRLPLVDGGGVVGVVAISRDVTSSKRTEARIQEEVRRRDQFLAMLSHELRNPLGAMMTASALLQADPENLDVRGKVLSVLDRQGRQMARLLDDLLEASRVTQDKIELRRSIVDLGSVVRDAVDVVRPLMRARDVQLRVGVAPEPLYVNGDPARLQQIQVNLLSNAAKYTPKGKTVAIDLHRDGAEAVVRVRDDGVGIPAEMLDTIFDLFVQSARTIDRSDGGLGVGLTLVKSLVRMHGGTVMAESDGPGRGSAFTVRLPLAEAEAKETPSRPKPSLRRPEPSHSGPFRIVVVEDNADSADMLCRLLGQGGHHCETANEGLSGLALIERTCPDVALVDLGLPGIDGFEIARRVRAQPKLASVMLVALTGYGQSTDRLHALEAGFDEHLVKPVDARRVMEVLVSGREAARTDAADAP